MQGGERDLGKSKQIIAWSKQMVARCTDVSENSPKNENGSKIGDTFWKFASSKLSTDRPMLTLNGSAKLVRVDDIIRSLAVTALNSAVKNIKSFLFSKGWKIKWQETEFGINIEVFTNLHGLLQAWARGHLPPEKAKIGELVYKRVVA